MAPTSDVFLLISESRRQGLVLNSTKGRFRQALLRPLRVKDWEAQLVSEYLVDHRVPSQYDGLICPLGSFHRHNLESN